MVQIVEDISTKLYYAMKFFLSHGELLRLQSFLYGFVLFTGSHVLHGSTISAISGQKRIQSLSNRHVHDSLFLLLTAQQEGRLFAVEKSHDADTDI